MRLLKHPGRPLQPRRQIAVGRPAGEGRVTLAPGAELAEALIAALQARGIGQAALQLLGGGFASLRYAVPEPERAGESAGPRTREGPLALVEGSGILGRGADGGPRLHCRAVLVDPAGRLCGGRLEAGACRVGEDGLVVLCAALTGAGFVEAHDPETDRTLFQPWEGEP